MRSGGSDVELRDKPPRKVAHWPMNDQKCGGPKGKELPHVLLPQDWRFFRYCGLVPANSPTGGEPVSVRSIDAMSENTCGKVTQRRDDEFYHSWEREVTVAKGGRTAISPAVSKSAHFRSGDEIDWLNWTSQSRAATMRTHSIDDFH